MAISKTFVKNQHQKKEPPPVVEHAAKNIHERNHNEALKPTNIMHVGVDQSINNELRHVFHL